MYPCRVPCLIGNTKLGCCCLVCMCLNVLVVFCFDRMSVCMTHSYRYIAQSAYGAAEALHLSSVGLTAGARANGGGLESM